MNQPLKAEVPGGSPKECVPGRQGRPGKVYSYVSDIG